jgi:hypothetical protein
VVRDPLPNLRKYPTGCFHVLTEVARDDEKGGGKSAEAALAAL